jgi:UDP-glucose 4-epimerase
LADVGQAVVHLVGLSPQQCGDGLFNLGGDLSLSVWDMTQKIAARCQATLGFSPEIVRTEPKEGEIAVDLQYDSHKLKQSGFHLQGSIEADIDATLYLCTTAQELKA